MKLHLILTVIAAWCSVFLGSPGLAGDVAVPDAGLLDNDVFVPELNALCGAGRELSKGCEAIREREIVDASASPWSAIGRVNFASTQTRQHCTGTLISEQLVLTASHCLYSFPRKSWIPASSIQFVAGYQRGGAKAVSEISRYVLDPVHDVQSRDFKAAPHQDWALLVLDDPIGQNVGWLDVQPGGVGDGDHPVPLLAGYAGLRPHVLSVARDCGAAVFSDQSGLLIMKCSAMHGDSGAPLLVRQDENLRVVGLFFGGVSTSRGYRSLAIPVSAFAGSLVRGSN